MAGGQFLLYRAAGAIGGAVSNLSKQGLKNLSGKQCGFDYKGFAIDAAIGAATGLIPGMKIKGISAGRGNFNSIYKQITTKFARRQISNIRWGTAAKMFIGRAVDTNLVPGTAVAAGASVAESRLASD